MIEDLIQNIVSFDMLVEKESRTEYFQANEEVIISMIDESNEVCDIANFI
jgi:hypothetical protein